MPGTDSDDHTKKRVGKACDLCRMKKTKCDGRTPCSKCSQDNKICTYTDRKKQPERTYSGRYVELLESRIELLQDCLQTLIDKASRNESLKKYIPLKKGRNAKTSITDIVERFKHEEYVDDDSDTLASEETKYKKEDVDIKDEDEEDDGDDFEEFDDGIDFDDEDDVDIKDETGKYAMINNNDLGQMDEGGETASNDDLFSSPGSVMFPHYEPSGTDLDTLSKFDDLDLECNPSNGSFSVASANPPLDFGMHSPTSLTPDDSSLPSPWGTISPAALALDRESAAVPPRSTVTSSSSSSSGLGTSSPSLSINPLTRTQSDGAGFNTRSRKPFQLHQDPHQLHMKRSTSKSIVGSPRAPFPVSPSEDVVPGSARAHNHYHHNHTLHQNNARSRSLNTRSRNPLPAVYRGGDSNTEASSSLGPNSVPNEFVMPGVLTNIYI